MILYHGSNTDIAEIDLSVSKVGKDFGCGFIFRLIRSRLWNLLPGKRNNWE